MGKCRKGPNKGKIRFWNYEYLLFPEELYFLELYEAVYLLEINEIDLFIDEIQASIPFALDFLLKEDTG